MYSTALFQTPSLLNPPQDDTNRSYLTSSLPASLFQKYINCLKVIQEHDETAQNMRGIRILDGSYLLRWHILYISVQAFERGSNLAIKLSEGIVTRYWANPCMRELYCPMRRGFGELRYVGLFSVVLPYQADLETVTKMVIDYLEGVVWGSGLG